MASENSVEIQGVEANLKRLAGQDKRARNKALKKGAEHIRKKLEQNTPESVKEAGKHLKEYTTITNVNADGEILIGFDKDVSYRAHFVELGTIYQPAQHFIQRTQQQTKEDFFNIVAEELRKELGL